MDHLRFKSEQTAAAYVADGLDPETREQFELHLMSCPECVEEVEGWRAIKRCLPDGAPTPTCKDTGTPCEKAGARDGGGRARAPAMSGGSEPSVPDNASTSADTCLAAGATAQSQAAAASSAGPPKSPGSGRSMPAQPIAPLPSQARLRAAMRWRLAATLAAGVIVGAAGGWYGRSAQGPSLAGNSIGFYSLPPLMRGPADCTSVRVGPQVELIALRVPAAAKEQQLVAVDSEGHDLAPDDYSVRMQADGSWLVRLRAQTVRDQNIRFEARSADGTVEPRGCVLSGSPD